MPTEKKTPKATTTIRIAQSTREKMSLFAKEKGIKIEAMTTRAMERILKDHPEFFLP